MTQGRELVGSYIDAACTRAGGETRALGAGWLETKQTLTEPASQPSVEVYVYLFLTFIPQLTFSTRDTWRGILYIYITVRVWFL